MTDTEPICNAGEDRPGLTVLSVISTPERRGAETFATQLGEFLRNRGHDVTVAALRPAPGAGQVDATVLGRSRWHPITLGRLVRLVRRHQVVISNGGTTLLPVAAVCAAVGRPFVYRNIGDPAAWGDVRGAGARIGAPLRRAAHVAALYDDARDVLIDRYHLQPDHVSIVPNAVHDPGSTLPSEAERLASRRNLGLDEQLSWIGYVGALTPEKRPSLAIEAVAADPNLGLVVAGRGPLFEDCSALAARLRPDRIVFLGSVPDSREILRAVDVAVIPSRTEGIPGVAVEAGLSGVPVVATDVGGVREVVLDGVTGVIVPVDPSPADLATQLRFAAAQREAFGRAAAQRCRSRFTFDVVGPMWETILRSATAAT